MQKDIYEYDNPPKESAPPHDLSLCSICCQDPCPIWEVDNQDSRLSDRLELVKESRKGNIKSCKCWLVKGYKVASFVLRIAIVIMVILAISRPSFLLAFILSVPIVFCYQAYQTIEKRRPNHVQDINSIRKNIL